MSLNNLNNVGIFPYSLNNLQVIRTSDGSTLPVTCNTPLIETTTSTAQNVKLYESSTDYINFATYNKSLEVTKLVANTGSFTSISSVDSNLTNISNTNFTGTTATITNINTANLTGALATITNLNSTNFTGTNAYLSNATIGNLTISGATIPFLRYTTATGTTNYTVNTTAQNYYNNVNPTNPIMYSINNNTTVSANSGDITLRPLGYLNSTNQAIINTSGRLSVPYITTADMISNNISNSQNITTATLNVTSAMTGSTIATSSTIKSGGVLSTTSGQIQNGNSTWTTNSNDVFINATNDIVYLRPKGNTATPDAGQVYLLTNGNLVCSTGTLTAWNGYFNNALNAPNANISCYGITSAFNVSSPSFTGANATITNISCTNLTGANIRGNFNGNVSVANPDKMYFYQLDKTTECMRIEPAFGTNVLSWYSQPFGSQLQFFQRAEASGGYFSCNTIYSSDYVASPNALHDNFYTTRRDGIQTNSMMFYNNTSFQSRPFIFQNLNQSAYIQAWGVNSRNNGFAIRDSTAERWFLYNKANTSTLAFNNNSSDLMTLDPLSLTVVPETKIQNTLNVGAPNFGSNALINLGYTGTLGGTLNSRMGYIFHDSSNLVINNQQFNNAVRQNSTIGSIYISPANGQFPSIFFPSGQLVQYSQVQNDAAMAINAFGTGGYGLYINKPNNASALNNYYNLVIQGNSYTSAIAMHAQVSGKVSNITMGRTNYPFTDDCLTLRPYSTASQDIWINISNHYQESNGKVFVGQNGTGSTRPSDAFIQNYSDNSGGKKSGIYFQTDTANQGVTAPAQYIDFTGQIFMNPFTLRTSGSSTQAGSAFSVNYGFKSLPQVGTVYTTSRGAGNYIPWIKANVNNVNYLVAGIQKIQLVDGGSVNASPFQAPAGARQYSARVDWSGVYDVRWNLNLFALAATNCFIYVYVNGVAVMTTIVYITAGNFSYCNGTKLIQVTAGQDIDMRIQPDVNAVTIGNNSTIDCIYHG